MPRLYLDAALQAGGQLKLDKPQAHYIGTVLRKTAGDSLRVFNGRGGEWRCQIETIDKKGALLRISEQLRAAYTPPDVWLCFAPVRKHRNGFIFEKGTELGVSLFQPVITARTQFPKMSLEKEKARVIEAAEQTERLDIPHVRAGVTLSELLSGWDKSRLLLFADEGGEAEAAGEILSGLPKGAACALLTGPEGGFTDEERALLRSKDYVRSVSLGPRILRADTAALSLLTLWQSVCGDW